jgi:hypothetical protein
MKTLILAILLLVPVPAHADTLVLFDEGPTSGPWQDADWVGIIFSNPPPGTTTFSVVIGNCPLAVECTYDRPIGLPDVRFFSTTDKLHELVDADGFGEMNYFTLLALGIPRTPAINYSGTWFTDNRSDSVEFRSGVYCGVGIDPGCVLATPEPSALWLLLTGSLALLGMKFSKR